MTLFFMHITKTAGGSLKELLKDAAARGEDIAFHYPEEPGFRREMDYQRLPRILFGHYVFGAHDRAEAFPNYACFFREPIARTNSHYYHLFNHDESSVGNMIRRFENLEHFLKYGRHWEFDNFLTRTISGVANRLPYGEVGHSTYIAARNNLRWAFSYIGIFERMNESLERLSKIVPGISTRLPKVNVGEYKPGIKETDYRLLRSLNRFDELLYEDALAMFDRAK